MSQNGEMFPLDLAVAKLMARWYASIYGDTAAVQEFATRGCKFAVKLAPGRMSEDAEEMLKAYRRDQQGEHGANAKLPVVIFALARDYVGTGGDWGARPMPRQLVTFSDAQGAVPGQLRSYYGLRTAMHDVRVQVAIFAADKQSARSLAAQFAMFLGDFGENRQITAEHRFGQYTVQAPAVIENPDMAFMVAGEAKNMTVLAGDFTLKVTTPFFDAPKVGELNDGSTNNPPGYPLVQEIEAVNVNLGTVIRTTSGGTTRAPA